MADQQKPITILAFSWNTQSNRICESLDEQTVTNNRKGIFKTKYRSTCTIMDFWMRLAQKIGESHPSIVIFAFQEDVSPGSYAHSDLLVEEMNKLQYTNLDRQKLMGIGKTTFEGLSNKDPYLRGLRISIYIPNSYTDVFRTYPADYYSDSIFVNKGAIACYVTWDGYTLAIINAHLPFDAKSLTESKIKKDPLIRRNAVMIQNLFFNRAYRKLVLDSKHDPQYVLFMGDLNYRIEPRIDYSAKETGDLILANKDYPEIRNYDELSQQINAGNIYFLKEGINDQGPNFAPTCKMTHDRQELTGLDRYKIGKFDQRTPSYCDRILYSTLDRDIGQLMCEEYDRLDNSALLDKSDHAGVIGVFSINN